MCPATLQTDQPPRGPDIRLLCKLTNPHEDRISGYSANWPTPHEDRISGYSANWPTPTRTGYPATPSRISVYSANRQRDTWLDKEFSRQLPWRSDIRSACWRWSICAYSIYAFGALKRIRPLPRALLLRQHLKNPAQDIFYTFLGHQ